MTVLELIKWLAQQPSDAHVFVNDEGKQCDPEPALDVEKNEVEL